MTDAELARLRELAEKATPGPWVHYNNKLRPQFPGRINEIQPPRGGPPIVTWPGFDNSDVPAKQHKANAAFIAAARAAVPTLIAEVERLRAELEGRK